LKCTPSRAAISRNVGVDYAGSKRRECQWPIKCTFC
jgi:hypothetical protein